MTLSYADQNKRDGLLKELTEQNGAISHLEQVLLRDSAALSLQGLHILKQSLVERRSRRKEILKDLRNLGVNQPLDGEKLL